MPTLLRWVAGAWAASVAARMRSASDSVRTTGCGSVSVIAVCLRRMAAVRDVAPFVCL